MENTARTAGNGHLNDYGTVENGNAAATNPSGNEPGMQKPAEESWSMKDILRLEVVRKALLCYGALALIAVMHDAIWTLW
jgi:hypothetical protein